MLVVVGRGVLSILSALAAVAMLSGPAHAGSGSLVGACKAALVIHAAHGAISFSEQSQDGPVVRLRFSFKHPQSGQQGQARCVFREARSLSTPPSLADLDATGRITPSLFLASHHAVWRFFRGDIAPEADIQGDEPKIRPEPIDQHSGRSKLASSTGAGSG